MSNLGIFSIGIYTPKNKRTNDWWNPELTNKWLEDKLKFSNAFSSIDTTQLPLNARLVVEGVMKYRTDAFEGTKSRYIMNDVESTSDMEIQAAKVALKRSGISASDIDFIITQSTTPDSLSDSNACTVHKALGLRQRCFSLDTTGMCVSFMSHLNIAEGLIRSGRFKMGIIIQSSGMSRFLDYTKPMSVVFGDGASATIVGAVPTDSGLLSIKHFTDGNLGTYFANGVEGKKWYSNGTIQTYIEDMSKGAGLNFAGVEQACLMFDEIEHESQISKNQISHYFPHQGMRWFGAATQKAANLDHATIYETFELYASVVGANIPFSINLAWEQNKLKKDDFLGLYAPGSGMTAIGALLKWNLS